MHRMLPAFGAVFIVAAAIAQDDKPDILDAIELPVVAHKLREQGVDEAQVDEVLDVTKNKKVPAAETTQVIRAAIRAGKEGPMGSGLGKFVKEKLGEGLSGQDLAKAIREENPGKGKGKGEHAGEGKGKGEHAGEGKGKGEHAGEGKGQGGEGKGQGGEGKAKAGQGGEGKAGEGKAGGGKQGEGSKGKAGAGAKGGN